MLFDLNPKEKVIDVYDRYDELKTLSDAIAHKERFSVVYGLRRVGKTSLIHALLNKREYSYLFIDIKEIYFAHGSVPLASLSELVAAEFIKFAAKIGFEEEAYEVQPATAEGLTELLKAINEWCGKKKIFLVVALDEAQYLRYGGKVRYDGIMAWCIDNLANIGFVLTGSEVGVLKEFLRYDDADAPLYGRFRREIYLDRFDEKKSIDFLKKGFGEYHIAFTSDELEETARETGGIVGWLTYYGYYRAVNGLAHKAALKKVFEEGSKITAKEIETLIVHSRKRYIYILKAISGGAVRWSEIKSYVAAKTGSISDTILNSLLQNLVKLGVIEKDSMEQYKIVDPLVSHIVKELKP